MPVWSGILIAFISTVIMNFGLTLQKRGAAPLPKLGKEKGAFKAFFTSKLWLLGTAGLLAGWGLYLWSAEIAPISIVQPTLGTGLAFLALFSIFYLHEKIKPIEWISVAGMIVGMILLGLGAPSHASDILPAWSPLLLVSGIILALAFGAYVLTRMNMLGGIRTDSLLGIVAGLFFGLAALYTRAMFLFIHDGNLVAAYGICMPIMVIGNLIGLGVMQSGFQHGKALAVVAMDAVTNKIIAIIGGMVALAEHLPDDPVQAAMRVTAFVFILFGSVFLSRFGGEEAAQPMEKD